MSQWLGEIDHWTIARRLWWWWQVASHSPSRKGTALHNIILALIFLILHISSPITPSLCLSTINIQIDGHHHHFSFIRKLTFKALCNNPSEWHLHRLIVATYIIPGDRLLEWNTRKNDVMWCDDDGANNDDDQMQEIMLDFLFLFQFRKLKSLISHNISILHYRRRESDGRKG